MYAGSNYFINIEDDMRRLLLVLSVVLLCWSSVPLAQGSRGDFGFGIILGEPTGATVKYWFSGQTALAASIGGSYFGAPRLQVDYLWHFDAFESRIIGLYAAPGLALGFGNGNGYWYKEKHGDFYYKNDNELGLGIRGVFGLNVVPRRTPLEIFLEAGALIGLAPDFGSAMDLALGIRFYP